MRLSAMRGRVRYRTKIIFPCAACAILIAVSLGGCAPKSLASAELLETDQSENAVPGGTFDQAKRARLVLYGPESKSSRPTE